MFKLQIALLSMLISAPLFADTIIFISGEELEATILERDETKLKVEVAYGTLLVPLVRVKRIDVDTPEQAEQRAKKRAEEKEFAERMKAEGKVHYKGEWVDEEVKKAVDAKLAEVKAKKKEAELAAKKKEAEVAAKKKAQELIAQQKAQQDQQTANNNFNNNYNNSNNSRNDRYNNNNNTINNGGSQNYNNNNVNSAFQSFGNGVGGYGGGNSYGSNRR